MARKKMSEEERKQKKSEYMKKYYKENKERITEQSLEYQKEHPVDKEKKKEYDKTRWAKYSETRKENDQKRRISQQMLNKIIEVLTDEEIYDNFDNGYISWEETLKKKLMKKESGKYRFNKDEAEAFYKALYTFSRGVYTAGAAEERFEREHDSYYDD